MHGISGYKASNVKGKFCFCVILMSIGMMKIIKSAFIGRFVCQLGSFAHGEDIKCFYNKLAGRKASKINHLLHLKYGHRSAPQKAKVHYLSDADSFAFNSIHLSDYINQKSTIKFPELLIFISI